MMKRRKANSAYVLLEEACRLYESALKARGNPRRLLFAQARDLAAQAKAIADG